MKKIYSCALLCFFLFTAFTAAANNITDNGTGKAYSLSTGDVLTITKGAYKGSINSLPAGASIIVQPGAAFQPQSINNLAGTITINGTAALGGLNINAATFMLVNYGTITMNSINLNGAATIINYRGAKMSIGGINFNSAASITNHEDGLMTISGGANLHNLSLLTNSGELHIEGGLNTSTGTFNNNTTAKTYINGGFNLAGIFVNSGYMVINGGVNLNSGTNFINNCSVFINSGVNNNRAFVNNGNVIIEGGLTNNSTIASAKDATIQGTDFTNNSTVTGSGNFRFTGSTLNNGLFGADKGGLNFYSLKQSSSTAIMDVQNGTVNATKIPVPMLDSNTIKNRCNNTVSTLPVKLTSFDVQSGNTGQAIVSWSVAEEIKLKEYIVEYSSDGKSFVPKGLVLPDNAAPATYRLPIAITSLPVQYFRLKMVDNDHSVQYSKVQPLLQQQPVVEKAFTIKINPAQSETIIALAKSNHTNVIIALLNPVGQPLWQQQVSNPGANSQVTISNLNRFAKGLYYVRVSDGATVQTQKLIIQ